MKRKDDQGTKIALPPLAEAIDTEQEYAPETDAAKVATEYARRINIIAEKHPEKMDQATAVVIARTGGEVIIISDPGLADFLAELRRYAQAGHRSPLAEILNQVVPMKWR